MMKDLSRCLSKKIFEIVRESGSESISIEETENSWVIIKAGLSTYNLAGMPNDEFPEFPEYEEDTFISFESYIFLELIEKVIYSIANEQENIYSLTSVLFEKESSDGYQLPENGFLRWPSPVHYEKRCGSRSDQLHLNEVTLIPKKGIQEWKNL